jgi:hypothetical protein
MAAAPAAAHSPIAGIGIFYSGALHPFISPAHLIALLALGLAIGQRGQRRDGDLSLIQPPLLTLIAALMLGLALHGAAGDPDTDRALLGLAAATGLGVAAAWQVPRAVLLVLSVAVGLAVALASAPTGVQGRTLWASLAGTGVAAAGVTGYAAVMVTVARRAWLHIAVRVLGSWFAAAALLVLALSFAAKRAG